MTGFSQTKINRVLAEGRERFRSLVSSSEDGSRCRELRPLLSAFCDGEASAARRGDGARAPARLRPLPGDDARLPGGAADRRRAGAGAAALALAARARARLPRRAGLAAAGHRAGGDSAATQVAAAGGSRGRRRWRRWPSCWRSARARPAARRPAWRRACCRRRDLAPRHAARAARSSGRSAGRAAAAAGRRRELRTRSPLRRPDEPRARSPSQRHLRPRSGKAAEPATAQRGAVEYEAPPPPRPNQRRRRKRQREASSERLRRRGVRAVKRRL